MVMSRQEVIAMLSDKPATGVLRCAYCHETNTTRVDHTYYRACPKCRRVNEPRKP